jgi:hypothetical protein
MPSLSRGEGGGNPAFLPSAAEVALACRTATARIADELRRQGPRRGAPGDDYSQDYSSVDWERREARVRASRTFLAERDAVQAELGRAMSMATPRPLEGMDGARPGKPWTLADTKRRMDELTEQILRSDVGKAA